MFKEHDMTLSSLCTVNVTCTYYTFHRIIIFLRKSLITKNYWKNTYCFIIISWVRKLYLTYRILNRIIEIANVTKLTNTVNDLKTILTKKTYLYYYICINRVGKFIFD